MNNESINKPEGQRTPVYLRHFWYLQAAHCFLTVVVMGQPPSDLHTGSSDLWVFLRKKARQE